MNLQSPCCLLRIHVEKKINGGGSSYYASLVARGRFKERDGGGKDQD